MGSGWAWHKGGYAYLQPQAGLVVREVWDMKTVLIWRSTTHPLGQGRPARAWQLSQDKVFGARHSLISD